MKRLLLVSSGALLIGACATPYPCYNIKNDDIAWQAGVVLPLGKGVRPSSMSGYTCSSTIDGDLLDPPLPFDDNMDVNA